MFLWASRISKGSVLLAWAATAFLVFVFLNLDVLAPVSVISYIREQPWSGYPEYLIPDGLANF